MRALLRLLFPLIAFTAPIPVNAASSERREVLATVQRLFDAMAVRDQAAIMALVLPDGRITSHRVENGQVVLRTRSWAEWAAGIAAATERLDERMHDPRVRIRGSLATVWTYYTFHRNGAFSHCGIDLFDMAKVDGRWRILNISYTAETEGCRRR